MTLPIDRRTLATLAAFFVSGAAGVVHETVWTRQLVQLIGAAAYAEVVVLAAFMGGLAVGAAYFGRRVDRAARPLALYGKLELGIAAGALLLPALIAAAGVGYMAVASRVFESGGLKLLLRLVLALAVVSVPAALMGGTLPVMTRALGTASVGASVGKLYAVNAFGAVAGTLLAGFVALPALGALRSLVLASALNMLAAALVWPFAGRAPPPGCVAVPRGRLSPAAWLTLGALLLSGFAAMGYEALFIRIIGLAFGSSAYAFTVMLACFIGGIALGSAAAARLRVERPYRWLGLAQLVVVLAFLAATPLLARFPYWIGLLRLRLHGAAGGFALLHLGAAALVFAVLLLPTACLGFTFPLVAGLRARVPEQTGRDVGATYAVSTAGNVAGVSLTTLVLLPLLGLGRAFQALLALNLLAGVLLLVIGERRRWPALAGAVGLLGVLATGTRWTDTLLLVPDHMRIAAAPQAAASFAAWRRGFFLGERRGDLGQIFLREDAHNTVVAYGPDRRQGGAVDLAINNKVDASTGGGQGSDLEVQLLTGHAPMLLAPARRSVLVIGHGSGITAGAALRYPVESLDVVEISPAVLAADALFAPYNHRALSDPRVHVYVEDAQSFVRTSPRLYDVIISEPTNPWIAGVADLFTVDFLTAARARLTPGGVFTFWVHTYLQSDETVAMLLRTLGTVFPHAHVFFDRPYTNAIVVASAEPWRLDFAELERRYTQPPVRLDLARLLGLPNLVALLSHHGLVQEGAEGLVGPGPVNTFDRQKVQYAALRSLFFGENSYLLEKKAAFLTRFDPADLEAPGEDAPLVDRYLSWRRGVGRPLTADELAAAAAYAESGGGYGPNIARALRARADAIAP